MKKTIGLILVLTLTLILFVGCSSTNNNKPTDEVKNVSLNEIVDAVRKEMGEDYLPEREMTIEEIESFFDIKKDQISDFVAEGPMMSVHVDMFVAIKAAEGQGDAVEEKMIEFMEMMQANTMQYPMNEARVKASRVVRHGDYIFYILLGKVDEREEATEEERLEFAIAEVDRVEAVINKFFE